MSTLFFIRHAQASFGEENYDRLSKRGFEQAQLLAEYLHDLPLYFDIVYTGNMTRHIDTAQPYLDLCERKGLPMPEVVRLAEFDEFDLSGVIKTIVPPLMKRNPSLREDVSRVYTDDRAFQRIFEAVVVEWLEAGKNHAGLLTWEDFARRVNRGVDIVLEQSGSGRKVGIFTSGGPISVVVQRALDLTDRATMRLVTHLLNSSISRFRCTTGQFSLATCNEFAHLELQKRKDLITYK